MNADLLPDPAPIPAEPREPEPCEPEPGELEPWELEPWELEPWELEPWEDADEDTDLDYVEMPFTDRLSPDGAIPEDEDDERWEAFIPDEDEWDPQPDPGDFRALLNVPILILAA